MKRLGDILVESGFLNATELAEVLSIQKEPVNVLVRLLLRAD
jgi:hypothetical protein